MAKARVSFIPTQIMPCFDWLAVLDTKDGPAFIPLVCWALGTVGNKSEVHGMIPDAEGNIISARSVPNFLGYEQTAGDEEYDIVADFDIN